jgi:hypothetical protein
MSPRLDDLDLRQFVGSGELSQDGDAGRVVSDFYAMAAAISSEGFDAGLRRLVQGLDTSRPATEVVSAVAQHLTRETSGLKGDILRKAVQETMLDAAGLGRGLEELNAKAGLEKFLCKRGTAGLLELFLSSYVFNTVWIRSQEAVRGKSGSRSLSKSMLGIQRFCTAAVRSVVTEWQAERKLEDLAVHRRSADTLIKTIETRLLKDS